MKKRPRIGEKVSLKERKREIKLAREAAIARQKEIEQRERTESKRDDALLDTSLLYYVAGKSKIKSYKNPHKCVRCQQFSLEGRQYKNTFNQLFICVGCIRDLKGLLTADIIDKVRPPKPVSKPYTPTHNASLEIAETIPNDTPTIAELIDGVRAFRNYDSTKCAECGCIVNCSWSFRLKGRIIDLCTTCYSKYRSPGFVKILYTPMGNKR